MSFVTILLTCHFFYFHYRNAALRVSGLDWASIAPCAKWMEPYYQVLEEEERINPIRLLETNDQIEMSYGLSHICPNLIKDHSHIIQTHSTSLDLFVSFLLLFYLKISILTC